MEEDRLTAAFRHIGARLRLSIWRITGSSDNADDAMQEAFCRLWQRRSEFRTQEHAERMLSATVHNAGIDIVRYRTRFGTSEMPDTPDTDAADTSRRDELLADVTAIINSHLTPEQRAILYERDRNGWSMEEIAEKHGITEANARMILSRSRKRVRELYLKRKNNEL